MKVQKKGCAANCMRVDAAGGGVYLWATCLVLVASSSLKEGVTGGRAGETQE